MCSPCPRRSVAPGPPRAATALAIAVIGGLLVSTFFTLVLIPTLYVIFEERFPRRLVETEESGGA